MNGRFLLVIPEFNDSLRLTPFLWDLSKRIDQDTDIQIVSDGSCDIEHQSILKLVEEIRQIKRKINFLAPIVYSPNKGKGAAIREGFKHRKEEHSVIGFVDADGSISAGEINRLRKLITSDHNIDAVFASRHMPNSQVERSSFRRLGSYTINKLIRTITGLKLKDTQCGLKLIKSNSYNKIENNLQSQRFEIDIEIAILLDHINANIKEEGVTWNEVGGSKVNVVKDTINLLKQSKMIKRRVSADTKS